MVLSPFALFLIHIKYRKSIQIGKVPSCLSLSSYLPPLAHLNEVSFIYEHVSSIMSVTFAKRMETTTSPCCQAHGIFIFAFFLFNKTSYKFRIIIGSITRAAATNIFNWAYNKLLKKHNLLNFFIQL